jgi:hypothetical protein
MGGIGRACDCGLAVEAGNRDDRSFAVSDHVDGCG